MATNEENKTTFAVDPADLARGYRYLLVDVARACQRQLAQIEKYKEYARGCAGDQRAGLLTKARELRYQATALQRILDRNNFALRHFFGTVKLAVVANNGIAPVANAGHPTKPQVTLP